MIQFVEPNPQDRKMKEMLQRYRNVFGTPEGLRVLGDILTQWCHFGVPLNTEEERIEYNVGVAIARASGIFAAIDKMLGIGED